MTDRWQEMLARRRAPDSLAAQGQRLLRRRMSAKRKQSAILRLLRGEDLEPGVAGSGVTAAELSAWRGAFLAAGKASLKSRPDDARDVEISYRPRPSARSIR
jgi:hypothetical protein